MLGNRSRRAPLQTVGKEPDVRFSYANERTFLAWNRTAMALIATGLAVVSLLPKFNLVAGRRLIGVPLIVLGAILSVMSYRRWDANGRTMRLGDTAAGLQPRPGADHRYRGRGNDRRGGCVVRISQMNAGRPGEDEETGGLAGERTDLAWSRSGVAVIACLARDRQTVLPDVTSLDAQARSSPPR